MVVAEKAPSAQPEAEATPVAASRRSRPALGLAFVALLASVIAAVGPADRVSTTYTWPPRALPAGAPKRLWYTPLLLIRHKPASVSARVPCSLPRPLPASDRPVTVLATARFPKAAHGMWLTRSGNRLILRVGDRLLARVGLGGPAAAATACSYTLRMGEARWRLEGGPNHVATGGRLQTMPTVYGLFSGLDLRSARSPSIHVTTQMHASRPTLRQKSGWTIAALSAIAALLLVSVRRRPRTLISRTTSVARRAASHAGLPDLVVTVVLLGWWVIAPAFFDDGWVIARQSMFSASGGFSNYYDAFATNLPLAYWLEWSEHWLVESTHALVFLRMPALLCLAATWVVCRWSFARISGTARAGAGLWALTGAFAVGALAWGMTLRFEPVIALLVSGVLACAVRFLERGTTTPLAVATVLVALAVSAHPAGIVSVAPLVVAGPRLLRWTRSHALETATILVTAASLVAVLGFVGADVHQRRADASVIRTYGDANSHWYDELARYASMGYAHYGTSLRRASVALMLLAVFAFVLRRRRTEGAVQSLPARSLAVALLLLVTTPSKWPWHFGALLGLVTVAVASAIARLNEPDPRARVLSYRSILALVAALLAVDWAWSSQAVWNDADLVSLDWTWSPGTRLILGVLAPFILLAVARALIRRRQPERLRDPFRHLVSWAVPALAFPLIAFTGAVFVTDAVKTGSWTLTRQNLDSLEGKATCGLAEHVRVPVRSSARPLVAQQPVPVAPPAWVPPAPADNLDRFALRPSVDTARTPWFRLSEGRRLGVFVSGTPDFFSRVDVEWGRHRGRRLERLSHRDAVWDDSISPWEREIVSWQFFDLPRPPRGADVSRLSVGVNPLFGSAVAVTAPVTYTTEPVAQRLQETGPMSLVEPNLLTYLPCVRQPPLSGGIVGVPGAVVAISPLSVPLIGQGTSAFDGLVDLYRLERMPLANARGQLRRVALYEVDRRFFGARSARPDKVDVVS